MSRARLSALALAAALAATGLTAATASATPPVIGWAISTPTGTPLQVLVNWTADQAGLTYQCGVDQAVPGPCVPGLIVNGSPGRHTLHIIASNGGGETSQRDVTIDFVDTKLTGGPAEGSLTSSRTATFTASSGYPSADYECVIDSGAFAACGPQIVLKDLADGEHKLTVRAHGGMAYSGQWETRSWKVDATAPETQLTVADTLAFASSEADSTYECRVDAGAFESCASPLVRPALAPGSHVFEVRATDKAGNVDPTPARHEWTVAAPVASAPKATVMTLGFRYRAWRTSTKLTRLVVTGVPAGERVTVTVKCPRGVKCPKGFSLIAGKGATSLKPLLGKALKPGTKITIRSGAAQKTLTIRSKREPKLANV